MATTIFPSDPGPIEFVEFCISEVLADLGAAEQATLRLDPSVAFDVGCSLTTAREALVQALTHLAPAQIQGQPQAHRLAA